MAYIKALAKQIAVSLAAVWTTENRLPVDTGNTANSVTIQDPDTSANKLKLNSNGEITVANQPTGFATQATLAATQSSLEERIGGTTDAPAADYNSASGLSGLLRLIAKLLFDGNSAASTTGNIKQQLRFLAENSGGGTQYDSGNIPTTPRGNLFLAIKSTGEVIPVEVDDSGYIKIAIAAGATPAPTEYFDGSSVVAPVGTLALGKQIDGTLSGLQLDNNGILQISAPAAIPVSIPTPLSVNVVSGGGGGVQYTTGVTQATPTGNVTLASKSGVLIPLQLDPSSYLQVNTPNLTNIQYTTGVTQATPVGNVTLANNSGVLTPLQLDTNNYLQVNTPNLTNVQYTHNTTQITPIGTVVLASKAGAVKQLTLDDNDSLKVAALGTETRIQAIENKIGTIGDTSNITGTLTQQLRFIGEANSIVPILSAISITATSGDVEVLGAVVGKQIVITSLYFTVTNGASVILKNGTTAFTGAMQITEHAADYRTPIYLSTNKEFVINISASASVMGYVVWYLV